MKSRMAFFINAALVTVLLLFDPGQYLPAGKHLGDGLEFGRRGSLPECFPERVFPVSWTCRTLDKLSKKLFPATGCAFGS